ncbi:MAG TPA: hypothetical protein DDZ51_07940 [Planctomycetaceae bacterium]|nr:hypothetical protein [Planctomycetaceae bacterium]
MSNHFGKPPLRYGPLLAIGQLNGDLFAEETVEEASRESHEFASDFTVYEHRQAVVENGWGELKLKKQCGFQ